jgi:hypothetical protein
MAAVEQMLGRALAYETGSARDQDFHAAIADPDMLQRL